MENKYPTGLLSFTYHVQHTEEVRKLALEQLSTAMVLFELSEPQKELVTKIQHESSLTDSLWEQYAQELRPEVEQEVKEIW